MPVTPENMGYVSVVCTGLIGFVIVLWFTTKRKKFTEPRIDHNLLYQRHVAALHREDVFEADDGEVFEAKLEKSLS